MLAIDPETLQIKAENILESLEVPPDKADNYLTDTIGRLIEVCLDICSPAACYTFFQDPVFVPGNGQMSVQGITFFPGKMVASALKKSDRIAFFIVTAGERVELHSKKLIREGCSLEGLIADLIGSEIAEEAAEKVHQRIGSEMAARGLRITNRYSPGYCNWPVSDQQSLFGLMGGNCCGVKLTKSSLMLPIKSISGIVGAGEHVRNRGYACAKCTAGHCIYRDKKQGIVER
jgi:hypothetical protein